MRRGKKGGRLMMQEAYKYITQAHELEEVIDAIYASERIGVDLETTSLDPRKGKLLTIQVATPEMCYVCNATKINLTPLVNALVEFDGKAIVQNGKFDLQFIFSNFGVWWQGDFYDPYIAHRLKNVGVAKTFEEKFVGLGKLALGYLGRELNKEIRATFQFSDGELTNDQIRYAAEDAAVLLPLYSAMKEKVIRRQSSTILDLEFSLLPITAMTEYYGIGVDTDRWVAIADEKAAKRAQQATLAKELFAQHIDWDINLNSWQQLKKAFNEYMGFNLRNTQAKTLRSHRYKSPELFDALLSYKGLQKAVSTYGHKWLRHVDNGSVYATFNQVGTNTGRYSCDSPPIQTIPIRDDPRYREAFVARPGYTLITADLSQIEFRLAGEFSGERVIIDEYNSAHPDFHQLTANNVSKVTNRPVERGTGKTMNFALLYQAGPMKLVEVLGCDKSEATALHQAYWRGYSTLQSYMYRTGYEAIVRGYSETKLGRRRYFVIAQNSPSWMIARDQRKGGNMPIQGSAADILKIATLSMFPYLLDYSARLVHQVHDELIIESPIEKAKEVANIVETQMIKAGGYVLEEVPVEVDVHVGTTWSK